jgi:GNAT superfamily N-acetyltransferase
MAFVEGKPVGFCALMPDLNQSLAFAKGKLKWWKYPRFLYNLKKGQPKIVKGVAFGIHPDYQRKGVFSEMVDFLTSVNEGHNPKTYDSLGLATIRGGNLAMLKSVSAALNVYVERVHLSFVRIFEGGVYEPYDSTDITEVPLGEVPDESIYPKA